MQGPIQRVEGPFLAPHAVAPDPDPAEGRGHPAFLQALTGIGRGGDPIERAQGLPVQLTGRPPALRGHLPLEADRLEPLIHRHPQLDHYTDLRHEAHLLFAQVKVSLRGPFVDPSEPRAAVRGTHPHAARRLDTTAMTGTSFEDMERRFAIAGALVVIASLVLPASSAWAACSTDEQLIFVREGHSGATGSAGTLSMSDRDLDLDCQSLGTGADTAWSTVHLAAVGDPTTQVEAGWGEYWKIFLRTYEHRWRIFWEWQIGNLYDLGRTSISCCPDHRFKVVYDPSEGKWEFFYHEGDTGSFTQFGPSKDIGITPGYPKGETGRRGGRQTGAADYHYHLSYRGSSGFTAWTSPSVETDTITNWYPVLSGTADDYTTASCGTDTC